MNLYELTKEWQDVLAMLEDPEIPDDAIFDTLEMIEGDMDSKADSYAKIIRDLGADVIKMRAEIERLAARERTVKARAERLKGLLESSMRESGRTKFKTALFTYSIQKNGGALPVIITGDVPDLWRKPGEIDKTAIRSYLQSGATLEFATLGERGESLRIK